jgi:hypothetical protein
MSPPPSPALPSGTRRAQRTARSVRGASILAASAAILVATPAQAEGDTFADTLILDSGRPELAPADAEKVELQVHGEYALRFRGMSDLRLEPPVSNPALTTLGQNAYAYHWFRLTPRFRYRDKLQLVAQIDIPRGLVLGDVTEGVGAVRDSMSEARWYEVHPRYLYLEYNSPIGIFRVGQQGAFWGMGILANDGDHPTIFGDYQRGSLSERLLFATTPMGKGTPLTVLVAGDMVFEDNTADLLGNDLEDYEKDRPGVASDATEAGRRTSGDRALQAVAGLLWRTKPAEAGLYAVYRHQERDTESVDALTPFVESLDVGVLDVTGKFHAPVPGAAAYLYGQTEIAAIFGSTSFVRNNYYAATSPTTERQDERVRTFGAVARLGVVHTAGQGKGEFGRLVTEVEWGYASGDADPYDGTTRRFSMDPNHNVGLVLFDHVLAWKSARAATNAGDPSLVNRPAPGAQLLPSKGSVMGATYLNPRVVVRPQKWLDLKGGVVIAQTTADFVDPYHAGALGSFVNYDGGDAENHDLGLELDLGVDARFPAAQGTTVAVGAEGGVLFPGGAFDDAAGNRLPNQYLAAVKAAVLF